MRRPCLAASDDDGYLWVGRFFAMASNCEVLLDTQDGLKAQQVFDVVVKEVERIEHKYSRYRPESSLSQMVARAGQPTPIDEETHRLLSFAEQLYGLSDGLFDITSGVLRRAWKFDGASAVPDEQSISACLPLVGWHQVELSQSAIVLKPGMELDLGGIGKEYAVDCAFGCAENIFSGAFLINLGGDLRAKGPRSNGRSWRVGIENPAQTKEALGAIEVNTLAVATSGNTKRFIDRDGIRFGHLLNPKTGWPVVTQERSVTVAASTCTVAGMLTSLALLAPDGPTAFLKAQEGVAFWTG